ncbi:MAG: hypothetical protein Q9180_002387 [Flavoplaca navasiana]
MSSTPSTREDSAFDKKPVLSDQQRKANHTSSETKRRNRIKAWYWDLCQLVPDLKDKAPENCKRERVVLDHAREFARATMRFEILPPVDPKGVPKSNDDTMEEEEERRQESAADDQNADDQDAKREEHKPPRKRRRRNKISTPVISKES